MKRVLITVVTLLGLAVARPAAAKPSIAILGLEVIEETDTPDAKAAQFAESLTNALRARARLSGPYTLAAGSDKTLVEMKLLSGCDNEGNACMAGIGGELVADHLIYGKIEKSGSNYQVSLKLLSVDSKSIERTTSDLAPISDGSGSAMTALGKKLYAKITGASNQGTLLIKANVERGQVFLDGESKAKIVGGSARIEGLSAGDYKLRIETDCYITYDGKVTVEGGKDATESVELEKNALAECGGGGDHGGGDHGGGGDHRIIGGGVSHDGRPGGGARALFWVSTAATVTGVAVFGFGYNKLSNANDKANATTNSDGDNRVCEGPSASTIQSTCDDGKLGSTLTYVGGGLAIAGGVAAAYFYYRGYVASKKPSERPLNARAPSRIQFAPTVSATTVGGVVHIEF
jgi:hypothetical protein